MTFLRVLVNGVNIVLFVIILVLVSVLALLSLSVRQLLFRSRYDAKARLVKAEIGEVAGVPWFFGSFSPGALVGTVLTFTVRMPRASDEQIALAVDRINAVRSGYSRYRHAAKLMIDKAIDIELDIAKATHAVWDAEHLVDIVRRLRRLSGEHPGSSFTWIRTADGHGILKIRTTDPLQDIFAGVRTGFDIPPARVVVHPIAPDHTTTSWSVPFPFPESQEVAVRQQVSEAQGTVRFVRVNPDGQILINRLWPRRRASSN